MVGAAGPQSGAAGLGPAGQKPAGPSFWLVRGSLAEVPPTSEPRIDAMDREKRAVALSSVIAAVLLTGTNMRANQNTSTTGRGLVWDIPVRLGHLLLVGGFAGAFALAEIREEGALFSLHMLRGLMVVVVAAFRIVWGLTGTRYARFAAFAWSPVALASYLFGVFAGRERPRHPGHNPATSYATVLILLAALGMGLTGALLTFGVGGELEDWHEALAFRTES